MRKALMFGVGFKFAWGFAIINLFLWCCLLPLLYNKERLGDMISRAFFE